MKTQLLIMSSIPFASSAVAQTQKGNGILSGNVSVNYNRLEGANDGLTTWTPGITLTAGRFWTDNWLDGLSLSGASTLTRQYVTQNSDQTYPFTLVSGTVTLFVRKYWQFNSVYLFAGAGLSVSVTDRKQPYFDGNGRVVENGQKSSYFGLSPHLEASLNYFVTKRLGIQLVANSSSLPLNAVSLNAGLVYWTGPDRRADAPEERNNLQTDAGRWVLEGNFSLNTQKDSRIENVAGTAYQSIIRTHSFNPSVGFFIKKNSLLGVSIPISYNLNRSINAGPLTTDNTLWGVGISPYFQHYWTSTQLTPYTRVSAGYIHYNSGSSEGNNVNSGITIGLAYRAGSRFIIETSLINASLNYLITDQPSENSRNKVWNAGISAGLTGNFAIRYVLQ